MGLPELEDTTRLGPAMSALTPRDRLFVVELFRPGASGTAAARAAGFGVKGKSKNTTYGRIAFRKLRQQSIVEAIEEESRRVVRSLAPDAVQVLREILGNKRHKDRLKAARTVLERTDPSLSLHQHQHDVRVHEADNDDAKAIEFLRQFRQLGAGREFLENVFGRNGLAILESKLAEQDAKLIGGPVIEGRAEPVKDDHAG